MQKNNDVKQPVAIGGSSFLVRVQFRQNASWQGTVQWLEGEKTQFFRSLFELISLIHQALDSSEGPQPTLELRSWEENKKEGLS